VMGLVGFGVGAYVVISKTDGISATALCSTEATNDVSVSGTRQLTMP
jgi:hypothetical protein